MHEIPAVNGKSESVGPHLVSHYRRLVMVCTDAVASPRWAHALLGSCTNDTTMHGCTTGELALYKDYDRVAMIFEPEQRIRQLHAHFAKTSLEPAYADLSHFILHPSGIASGDVRAALCSQTRCMLYQSKVQAEYFLNATTKEHIHEWLPWVQRRWHLMPVRPVRPAHRTEGELTPAAANAMKKAYAEDYSLVKLFEDEALFVR